MKEYDQILALKGDPHKRFMEEMLSYAQILPKSHRDKMINQKLNEIFTSGIDLRLLNKEEYIKKLKEKARRGYRVFLFNPLKPTTEEEIEVYKDSGEMLARISRPDFHPARQVLLEEDVPDFQFCGGSHLIH